MLKVKEAWKEIYLRHINNGAVEVIAAQLTNVGMDKVFQARTYDPQFHADIIKGLENQKKQVRIC